MSTTNRHREMALIVGALGIVYGDIGTSPLYALRECFNGTHGVEPTPANVIGIISLVLWSLVAIVSIKYLGFVLRADNKGEGGILALLALAIPDLKSNSKKTSGLLIAMGIFGAALLYGDGMITPAITVLGAMEGLEVATPIFNAYVVPLAILVLAFLFSVQRHGTGRVGSIFGPIMCVWFATIAFLGVWGICMAPRILQAINPFHGILFLLTHGKVAFVVLGAVFLALTGAEALYADMGHFGARSIRKAWFILVFPSLTLNYFGQGALLLVNPGAAANPFFMLAPAWAVYPLVGLATCAAIIASQALISGAYSLTMHAIQLGLFPRLIIRHTSQDARGQIYMPQVNWMLMIACVGLVVGFKSSGRLAGAYGIAVSMTMIITSLLFYFAARRLWNWPAWKAGLICGVFLSLEIVFLSANALKIVHGGWFPLVVGAGIYTLMSTWQMGRRFMKLRLADSYLPCELFLEDLKNFKPHRVNGTSVFLSGNPTGTPIALLHNLKHNKVLHKQIVLLTILYKEIPYVDESERIGVDKLEDDCLRVTGNYGFMEQPNIPQLLNIARESGMKMEEEDTTFFLSRETIISTRKRTMPYWRKRLFSAMSRNAQSATAFFNLPPSRVVELGMQVEL